MVYTCTLSMANSASPATSAYLKPEFLHTVEPRTLSRLIIPPEFFAENMAGFHQDDTVTLISDQLSYPWVVSLEGETLRDGWSELARALRLKVSDFLVFRYEGNYVFKFTAFRGNGEEIEHQYWEQDEGVIDEGRTPRSQRSAAEGNSPMTARGIRSHQNAATEDMTSFQLIVTESNVGRNEVYLPKRFVELNGLDAKRIGWITLTNNDGRTWKAVVKVCSDRRLKIGRCWTTFCYENDILAGDCCQFKLVENSENIVIRLVRLVGLDEDEEEGEVFPEARAQPSSSSRFGIPEVQGVSMYSTEPSRGPRGRLNANS